MKSLDAREFQRRFLEILESLGADGVEFCRDERPIARLMPVESSCGRLIGSLKSQIVVDPDDDLLSTGAEREAQA